MGEDNLLSNPYNAFRQSISSYPRLYFRPEVIVFSRVFHQWLYRGGHPNLLARASNRFWAIVHACGIAPNYMVTLRVVGRRSGRPISFPLAMTTVDGQRYLVSMLGTGASWVRNVRATGGHATLVHGRSEAVQLEEVPVERRAPILKAYLRIAPGARPHLPVDKDAPLAAFAVVAPEFPVFHVLAETGAYLEQGRNPGKLDGEPVRSIT
jgi:hypothetical protein